MTSITTDQMNNPFVFIHGSYANSNCWKKITEALTPEYKCYSVDLPGHGKSADPDDFENPTLNPEFNRIQNLVHENSDLQSGFHLVGHSFGGVVALNLAISGLLPVRKITLFETVDASVLPLFGNEEEFDIAQKFVEKYFASYKAGDKFACSKVIDFWGGPGSFEMLPEHVRNSMALMTKHNIRHWNIIRNIRNDVSDYKALDIPITVVHGTTSNNVAKTISSALHKNINSSRIKIIHGASHFMITSHPAECAKIILDKP